MKVGKRVSTFSSPKFSRAIKYTHDCCYPLSMLRRLTVDLHGCITASPDDYRFITYIVTSKPNRISSTLGVVHINAPPFYSDLHISGESKTKSTLSKVAGYSVAKSTCRNSANLIRQQVQSRYRLHLQFAIVSSCLHEPVEPVHPHHKHSQAVIQYLIYECLWWRWWESHPRPAQVSICINKL